MKCEGLDFSGELGSIVENAYLSYFGDSGSGDPTLQAKLASAMVVTLLRYKLAAGESFTSSDIHPELDVLHRRAWAPIESPQVWDGVTGRRTAGT